MWFRNLTLFRYSKATGRALDACAPSLDQHRLRPCGPLELSCQGFVSPYGRDEPVLTHESAGHVLIGIGCESRLLPAAVVNDELAARLRTIAAEEKRKVGARERRRLKEAVLSELLPRAFVRFSRVNGYFASKHGWLVLDTASRKAAEDVVQQLRQALGSFPALPMTAEESPRTLMTEWLIRGKLPPGLEWGDECELRDPTESGAVVRCRHQDLETDEVREHLKSGKQVFQLGLIFDDRIGFVLGEDLCIRKLRFLDQVREQLDESAAESAQAELHASFTLMALELDRLLQNLEKWFGLSRPDDKRG